MASLLVLTGAKQGQRVPLQGDRIVLGRDAGCDVVINFTMVPPDDNARTDSVSRRHAVIARAEGHYFIEDGDGQGKKSRNGVFVNDQQVPFSGRTPLRDGDHIRICGFACTFHDDAEPAFSVEASLGHESSVLSFQVQPAEKLRVILQISNDLSNTLDVDVLLPRIVDHLFQLFKQADRGFVILREEASRPPHVRVFKSRRPDGEADARFSNSIVQRCLESVQAILGNDLPQQFPDSASVVEMPVRSLMCAPLWSQDGQSLGAIQLDTRAPKAKFTQDDLNLLLGVASQASIALCNARLHREALANQGRKRDLEVAHQVQRALLPQQLPSVPGYEFYAHYEAAQEVGGDYYDFIPLPRQRLAVLLGDVAGKGVPAALVMAKFSVEARVCLETEADLAVALSKLNALMRRAALPDKFVTLAAVVLDPARHTATLVNAGHPSPLLFRHATGEVEQAAPVKSAGPPIGIDDHVYASCEIRLIPGDGLLLFSDGVTEAMDQQRRLFGTKGVRGVLERERLSPHEAGERVLRAVKRHAAGCDQHDDITLVSFGRAGA
jgi:serine phosphatase RsbU (regulator of sigma subunit)/pSer/pThr/pTyr-binding forkhead associated (FHA) protein